MPERAPNRPFNDCQIPPCLRAGLLFTVRLTKATLLGCRCLVGFRTEMATRLTFWDFGLFEAEMRSTTFCRLRLGFPPSRSMRYSETICYSLDKYFPSADATTSTILYLLISERHASDVSESPSSCLNLNFERECSSRHVCECNDLCLIHCVVCNDRTQHLIDIYSDKSDRVAWRARICRRHA